MLLRVYFVLKDKCTVSIQVALGCQGRIFPSVLMLAFFQNCSSDGPGQPSMQETPENKNNFQEKEAQDQGSTLRSQTRLSEVHQGTHARPSPHA